MLILSEWPPRAMLLEDTSFLNPDEQEQRGGANACKHQDDVAWNLVGLVCVKLELTDTLGCTHRPRTCAPGRKHIYVPGLDELDVSPAAEYLDQCVNSETEADFRLSFCRPAVSNTQTMVALNTDAQRIRSSRPDIPHT